MITANKRPQGLFINTNTMKFIEYLKDVKAELRHVKWPTQKTAFALTLVVVVLTILTAMYVGAFDFIFSETITNII